MTCGNQLAIVSVHENIERTFSQLVQDVDRFANALRINCNVRSGDVISVWTANSWFFVIVQYAAAALGAILCPINAYYKAKEVWYCLEKVKPKVLIMPGGCFSFVRTYKAKTPNRTHPYRPISKLEIPTIHQFQTIRRPVIKLEKNFFLKERLSKITVTRFSS